MRERQFEFEWNEVKAAANALKHGVSFDLARTIFNDPFLVTVADLEHSEAEERWFSIGRAANGSLLSVAYLWSEVESATKIRVISARKATRTEIRQYEEVL
ncbi:MAG TPA: BrnT family toxin [Terriglobales bacterium]|nr:BrnT family toxin [Terriglobales bacterium]